jgi:hypothetical protein
MYSWLSRATSVPSSWISRDCLTYAARTPPGQPSPEDIQIRDRAVQLLPGLSRGSIEDKLYRTVWRAAEERIQWSGQRDEPDRDRSDR